MPPDFTAFHMSLSAELESVKDRIRNLVDHWATDGEHKEIVLQTVLRRYIGRAFVVGKGFIVDRDTASGQIDLMVIDGSSPTLFRDGDFFITTPDAVRAVIEVKTSCEGLAAIQGATEQLRRLVSPWAPVDHARIWSGLFVYERRENANTMRNHLVALATGESLESCPVNCISVGRDKFIRWWPRVGGPAHDQATVQVWRSYELEQLAPAYFVGNLIQHLNAASNGRPRRLNHGSAWFPIRGEYGKERLAQLEIGPGDGEPRQAARPDRAQDLRAERNAPQGHNPAADPGEGDE